MIETNTEGETCYAQGGRREGMLRDESIRSRNGGDVAWGSGEEMGMMYDAFSGV
jgi:hypothetical protein